VRRVVAALSIAVLAFVWAFDAHALRADPSPARRGAASFETAATTDAVAQLAVLTPPTPSRGAPPSTAFAVLFTALAVVAAIRSDAATRRRGLARGVMAWRAVRTRGPPRPAHYLPAAP
jgi:hypothetical protein